LFPKGLPVARVEKVTISDLSLFKDVQARSLVDVKQQEEVLAIQCTKIDSAPVQNAKP
jgi:cell shape-determining protein MreC